MPKLPWLKVFPGDWLREGAGACSLAAQGLLTRLMFLMHDSEQYGYLVLDGLAMTDEYAARMCGSSVKEYKSLLDQLVRFKAVCRTPEGVIFSSGMVRESDISCKRAVAGSKGGVAKSRQRRGKALALTMPSDSSVKPVNERQPGNFRDSSFLEDDQPYPPQSSPGRGNGQHDRLLEALGAFKPLANWEPPQIRQWEKLVDEGLGEDRVIQLLMNGHKNGQTLQTIKMAGWEEVRQKGKEMATSTKQSVRQETF